MKCKECNGSEFHLDDGIKICIECGNQIDYVEIDSDIDLLNSIDMKFRNVTRFLADDETSESSLIINRATEQNWTTFEAFNIVLVEWTNILIKIGFPEKLRTVVLNLWVTYLQKRNIAFDKEIDNSFDEELGICKRDMKQFGCELECKEKVKKFVKMSEIEKLQRNLLKQNLKYGKLKTRILINVLSKSLIASQIEQDLVESEEEETNKKNTSIYEKSFIANASHFSDEEESISGESSQPTFIPLHTNNTTNHRHFYSKNDITPEKVELSPLYLMFPKLLSFIFIGLRMCDQKILAYDLLRWCRQGKIPYYTAIHLMETGKISSADRHIFNYRIPSTHQLIFHSMQFANYIDIKVFPLPNEHHVLEDLAASLNLPDDILEHSKKVFEIFYPFGYISKLGVSIEIVCAVTIILTLKIYCCLDDEHESVTSEAADKINLLLERRNCPLRLFSFRRWQIYMNKFVWWVNQIDKSSSELSSEFSSDDCERFCNDFWTRSFWETLPFSDEKGNCWYHKLLEKTLVFDGTATLKDKVNQPDLFKIYKGPFIGLLNEYIETSHDFDPSKNKKQLLKMAHDLKRDSFKSHDITYLQNPSLINSHLAQTEIPVNIIKIPMSNRRMAYQISVKHVTNEGRNNVFIPDPFDSFVPINVQNFKIAKSMVWLFQLLSRTCETNITAFIRDYVTLERKYLFRFKST